MYLYRLLTHFIFAITKIQSAKKNTILIKYMTSMRTLISCVQNRHLFGFPDIKELLFCSMNKSHHLFFLHRLIVLRNEYTEMCHKIGRKPLLPKAKSKDK